MIEIVKGANDRRAGDRSYEKDYGRWVMLGQAEQKSSPLEQGCDLDSD